MLYCIAQNFLRDKLFADCPLANFCRNKSCGSGIPVSHTHFWHPHALVVFTVATTPCSAGRFKIQAYLLMGELRLRSSQFHSLSSSTTCLKRLKQYWCQSLYQYTQCWLQYTTEQGVYRNHSCSQRPSCCYVLTSLRDKVINAASKPLAVPVAQFTEVLCN